MHSIACSEEIFDFSKESLTQAKIKELKESLNSEFALIFQLCDFITDNASKPSLITVTLQVSLRKKSMKFVKEEYFLLRL